MRKEEKIKLLCACLNGTITEAEAKYLFKNGINIPVSEWASEEKPNIQLLNKIGFALPPIKFVC